MHSVYPQSFESPAGCGAIPTDARSTRSTSGDASLHLSRVVDSLTSLCALGLKQRELFGWYVGVSGPQYQMISEIERSTSITVSELAQRLDVSGSFVAVEAKKLISLGIIEKRPNTFDRRSVILELSSKGRNALALLDPLREELNQSMCRSLDSHQYAALQHMVDRLVADASEALTTFERSIKATTNLEESRTPRKLRLRSARLV